MEQSPKKYVSITFDRDEIHAVLMSVGAIACVVTADDEASECDSASMIIHAGLVMEEIGDKAVVRLLKTLHTAHVETCADTAERLTCSLRGDVP